MLGRQTDRQCQIRDHDEKQQLSKGFRHTNTNTKSLTNGSTQKSTGTFNDIYANADHVTLIMHAS